MVLEKSLVHCLSQDPSIVVGWVWLHETIATSIHTNIQYHDDYDVFRFSNRITCLIESSNQAH